MSRGEQIAARARAWIGTPYLHQASLRGAGTDCLGLIRGLWRETVGQEPFAIPAYSRDWAEYGARDVLQEAAFRWLVPMPADTRRPGMVLLFRMRAGAVAKHLGVLTVSGPQAKFVHAYTGHGVVESPLSEPWARKVVSVFAFPEGI